MRAARGRAPTVAIYWGPWQPLPVLPGGTRLDREARLVAVQADTFWLIGRVRLGSVMAIELAPGQGWGAWRDLGGDVVGDTAAGMLDDGRVEVFGRRSGDDRLMARRQVARGRWS